MLCGDVCLFKETTVILSLAKLVNLVKICWRLKLALEESSEKFDMNDPEIEFD